MLIFYNSFPLTKKKEKKDEDGKGGIIVAYVLIIPLATFAQTILC